MADKEKNQPSEPRYETPQLIELGYVVDLTLGSESKDTADMATRKYY